jgi:hypothetical protein
MRPEKRTTVDINQYFKTKQSGRVIGSCNLAKRIVCENNYSISVQANECAYCTPRDNYGPYSHVECGHPIAPPSDEMMEYADERERPTETIYQYVPVEVVERLIESHGGIKI